MNRIKIYILLVGILIAPLFGFTQTSVVVGNTQSNTVLVKWLTDKVINSDGVNIYRKKQGESSWTKLNSSPYVIKANLPSTQDYSNDEGLKDYIGLIDELGDAKLEGIAKVLVIIKAMQSQPYAKYLGIQYDDKTAVSGQVYQYKIMQITGSGEKEIGISKEIVVEDYKPIDPPKEIKIKPLDGQVQINWQPDEYRFYGVNILRRNSGSNTDFKIINELPIVISKLTKPDGTKKHPDVFFTDTTVENGKTYEYVLQALDFFGRAGKQSEIVKALPKDATPPPAPKTPKAKVNVFEVELTWENRASNEIIGIYVYRSTNSEKGYKRVYPEMLPPGSTYFKDIVDKAGFYYYYVASVDIDGNEGASEITFADIADITPPKAPRGLYTKADTGTITLKWLANNEDDLLGYRIYRTVTKNKKENFVLQNATPITDTVYVDTLPKNAKNSFLYKVVAVDTAYNMSEFSNVSSNKMPDVVPPVKPYIKNYSREGEKVIINWMLNVELYLLGYDIYRVLISDSVISDERKLNVNIIKGDMDRFTDRYAIAGRTYGYYIFASDSAGNISMSSDTVLVDIPKGKTTGIPLKNFTIKTKSKKVILQWEPEDYDAVDGYVIYRKIKDGKLKPLSGMVKESTKYIDSDLTPNTQYSYQIRIYSKEGGVTKSEIKEFLYKEN